MLIIYYWGHITPQSFRVIIHCEVARLGFQVVFILWVWCFRLQIVLSKLIIQLTPEYPFELQVAVFDHIFSNLIDLYQIVLQIDYLHMRLRGYHILWFLFIISHFVMGDTRCSETAIWHHYFAYSCSLKQRATWKSYLLQYFPSLKDSFRLS